MSEKKYKVIGRSSQPALTLELDQYRMQLAKDMQDTYGLHSFTLAEIIVSWEAYSDLMCAGWLVDDKESIEEVFGVELEEISEEE